MLLELSAAGCRQRVVLGVPVVLAGTPLRFQLAVLFQAVERREQRTGIDPEMIVTERGQSLRQAVAVQGLAREDCKNHQLERPLRDVDLVQCLRVTLRHNRRSLQVPKRSPMVIIGAVIRLSRGKGDWRGLRDK